MSVSIASPLVATDIVPDASQMIGQSVTVGSIAACSILELIVTSCETAYSTISGDGQDVANTDTFQLTPTGSSQWRVNHDDQQFDPLSPLGPDFNDLVLLVEVVAVAGGDDDDDDDDDDDTDPNDSDGDGVTNTLDCAPLDPTIYPGAPEFCDGVDSDCGGETESTATGGPQEMFAVSGGDLLLTVQSQDADCFMTVSVASPMVANNVVADASAAIGQTINIGSISNCSMIEVVVNSCSPPAGPADPANDYSTTNGNAFQIVGTGTDQWSINHDDQQFDLFGADFDDLVLLVEVD